MSAKRTNQAVSVKNRVRFLISYLQQCGVLKNILSYTSPFTGIHIERAVLQTEHAEQLYGFGSSVVSRDVAVLKALAESLERLCLRTSIPDSTPAGQVLGIGVGCETTAEFALQQAVYEHVERDAALSSYLLRAPVTHLSWNAVQDHALVRLRQQTETYGLDVELFDITTDLAIPVFMSVVIDRSGNGPAVSIGLKAGYATDKALRSAVEESVMVYWTYRELSKNKTWKASRKIPSPFDRSTYWSAVPMIRHLSFWLGTPETTNSVALLHPVTAPNDLAGYLAERGYPVTVSDITIPLLRDIGYHVYETEIPDLQHMYVDEKKSQYNRSRLRTVANYYGKGSALKLNPVPHPFV